MGLHSTFLASPSSSYGDQDHDDADNNDVHADIDDGDADISTFLARPSSSYGDQDEGCGDDDHASSNSNNNSTKIFIDGCPLSIQRQFVMKTCLKVPWILFM